MTSFIGVVFRRKSVEDETSLVVLFVDMLVNIGAFENKLEEVGGQSTLLQEPVCISK